MPKAVRWQKDPVIPGLRHNGRTWTLRYRVGGIQRHISLGSRAELSAEEARRLAVAHRQTVREGGDPLTQRYAAKDRGPTLGTLVDDFIASRERASRRSTVAFYRSLANRLEPLRELRARSITPSALTAALDKFPTPTANRLASLLRASFSHGIERGRVAINPALMLRRRREPPRDRILSEREVGKLLRTLRGESRFVALAVRLMLATAQRVREVLDADFDELGFKLTASGSTEGRVGVKCVWTIPASRRKQRVSHTVYMPPSVAELILEAHGLTPEDVLRGRLPKGRVCPGVASGWRHRWTHALFKRVGLSQPWTLRDLRRSWATHAGALGISEEVIALVLGHSPATVTGRVYSRASRVGEREAAMDTVWRELRSTERLPDEGVTLLVM